MPNQFGSPQAKARQARARLAKELATAETTATPPTQTYNVADAYIVVERHEEDMVLQCIGSPVH